MQPRIIDKSSVSKYPPHVREIWAYLLRRANHRDVVSYGVLIKRGQLKTSYSEILEDLSWRVGYRKESYKRHHCETAMKLLTKEQMVTTTKTTRGMIVTICNYDYYQNPKNDETYNEIDNETTMKPQSSHTINKNVKNVKNNPVVAKAPTVHVLCKNIFIKKYNSLYDEEYCWTVKDGANLKSIITKIKNKRRDNSMTVDDESVLAAFSTFIDFIKDKWLLDHFTIPNINSKYNEIMSQGKKKNRKKLYSYEEASAMVTAGRVSSFDDFEKVEVEGVVYRVLKGKKNDRSRNINS